MSRSRSEFNTKTPGIISLALLLLGGLGFWAAGGSAPGVGGNPSLFAEDGHVAFAPPGEQSGVLKRTGERPPAGDDDGSPWLAGRAPRLLVTFLSESFPADAAHDFYSGTAPYPPQIPRAPPLA